MQVTNIEQTIAALTEMIARDYMGRIGSDGFSVYTLLAIAASKGEPQPTIIEMARQIGLSRNTVKKTLRTLAREGLVELDQTTRVNGEIGRILYRIRAPEKKGE